jgi:hypothetical protein
MQMDALLLLAIIEKSGVPALRVAFTIAVIILFIVGVFIWRRRHQFFDRDPLVDDDIPVVRHNREEVITSVWGGLTVVLIVILFQLWRA